MSINDHMATTQVEHAPNLDVLVSSSALLDAHEDLLKKLEAAQQRHRAILTRFPSPAPGLSARSIVPSRSPRQRKRSIDSNGSNDDIQEVSSFVVLGES